jgi:hypothetical protein
MLSLYFQAAQTSSGGFRELRIYLSIYLCLTLSATPAKSNPV